MRLRLSRVLCSLSKEHLELFEFGCILGRLDFESVGDALMLQLHAHNVVRLSTVGFLKSVDLFFELFLFFRELFLVITGFLHQLNLNNKIRKKSYN